MLVAVANLRFASALQLQERGLHAAIEELLCITDISKFTKQAWRALRLIRVDSRLRNLSSQLGFKMPVHPVDPSKSHCEARLHHESNFKFTKSLTWPVQRLVVRHASAEGLA